MKGLLFRIFLAAVLWMIGHAAYASTVTYVYSDVQGTPLAEADASGNITATFDYRPYGAQALGQTTSGLGYAANVNDPDSGLVYMQARYYDPGSGLFLSKDPSTNSFSRYSYANNNPVSLTDRRGKEPDCDYHCMRMRTLADKSVSVAGVTAGGGFNEAHTFVDSAMGQKATEAANVALNAATVKKFGNLDDVAVTWLKIVLPIALHFNTEILSKMYEASGGYTWGPAYSSGDICSSGCFVSFNDTPDLSGGVFLGYVHTHPANIGFSGWDIYTAYNAYTELSSLVAVHAYVGTPDGHVFEWNTGDYFMSPRLSTFQGYAVYARTVK